MTSTESANMIMKFLQDLSAEQILIRSGNIGSVRIAQKIGAEKFKIFLEK